MTPEQQGFLSNILGGIGPQAAQTYQGLLGGQTMEDQQALFQQSYIDPAMQALQQQIAPAIQQRFADANAGSSSALNQALSQSATDLSTALGSQFGQFQQQQQTNQLSALSGLGGLAGMSTFQPVLSQQQGLAGPLLQAGGQAGAAAIMASSRDIKENIKPYKKGLEAIKELEVKMYDYIEDVGGQKDKVGLIAEDVPKELTATKDEILHVDLYGLIGLLINSVQQLNDKIEQLEEAI